MYTKLPKTKTAFNKMVDQIMADYQSMPTTDELLHRIQLDLTCLLKESELKIMNKKAPMRLIAYRVSGCEDLPYVRIVCPLWQPISKMN